MKSAVVTTGTRVRIVSRGSIQGRSADSATTISERGRVLGRFSTRAPSVSLIRRAEGRVQRRRRRRVPPQTLPRQRATSTILLGRDRSQRVVQSCCISPRAYELGFACTMGDARCMVYVSGLSPRETGVLNNTLGSESTSPFDTPSELPSKQQLEQPQVISDGMDAMLHVVDVIRNDGSDQSHTYTGEQSTFNSQRYFQQLRVARDGKEFPTVLITTCKTTSTQSSLQQRAGHVPHGTVFVADRQVGGRGRGGNIWESPDGCLMFSISLKYSGDGKTLPFVQYVVSLAIVETITSLIHALGDGSRHEDVPIRIKWPNDIYYCPRNSQDSIKIGGILCHSSFRDSSFCMTIGMGINVSNSQPTTCLNDILHQCGYTNGTIRREDVVAGIVHRLDTMLPLLAADGFDQFKAAYYDAWLHSGQCVSVKDDAHGSLLSVRICGLTDHGYLLAIGDGAQQYELCPDGNSFDFLHGLIVSKTL